MIKDKLISGACITVVVFLVPYILTLLLQPKIPVINAVVPNVIQNEQVINIEHNNVIQNIGFEEYIIGVLAAEMPANFEPEALKAQAVAARTYSLRRITDKNNIDAKSIGQSYLSKDEMRERWGDNYITFYSKIETAVKETQGEVLEYKDELI